MVSQGLLLLISQLAVSSCGNLVVDFRRYTEMSFGLLSGFSLYCLVFWGPVSKSMSTRSFRFATQLTQILGRS